MKKFGVVSVGIFLMSAVIYTLSLFWNIGASIPGSVMIALVMILPVIGLITAFLSNKGATRTIGLIGNIIVLFFTVILPASSMLFWNQP
ncbi:hypothetical protein ACFQPF_17510 [Fictibacillus iocasae]|uniref:Uncharacterized protein n=1 Tax=Fictibacillus iocasae TaxID=2715437 RepID=A0ABW2NXU4_9BACL